MKEKIIFIGDGNHKKTKSDRFLIDYLSEFYDVEIHYDYIWNNGPAPDYSTIAQKEFKAIVFWLIFPPKKLLKKLRTKTILFFPMYDGILYIKSKQWQKFKNVNIVNFSSTLHKKLKKFGLKSCYLQYFPKPQEQIYYGKEDEIFFWQRPNRLLSINIFEILQNKNYKIHIHEEIELAKKLINSLPEHQKKYQITFSRWFPNKNEVDNLIKEKAIYIAPRTAEGIGMSFLEAMAMGKVVIANNAPTMNEYIEDGKTGFLFNYENPQPIDIKNIKQIQENTYEYIKKGYQEWLENKKIIIDIIEGRKKLKSNRLKLIWNKIYPKAEYIDPFQKLYLKKYNQINQSNNSETTRKTTLKKIKHKIRNALFPSYKFMRKIHNKLNDLEYKISAELSSNNYLSPSKIDHEYLKNHSCCFIQKFKIKDQNFSDLENKKLLFLCNPASDENIFAANFLELYKFSDKNFILALNHKELFTKNYKIRSKINESKIIHGNLPYGLHNFMGLNDEEISHLTLVRNPAEFMLSMYNDLQQNFILPENMDFNNFINSTNNIQTKAIAGFSFNSKKSSDEKDIFIDNQTIGEEIYNQAIQNIENHFFLIAPSERLQDAMRIFITIANLPNIITHFTNENRIKLLDKITDQQIAEIEKNNHWDIKLHEYATRKFADIYGKFLELNKENLSQFNFSSNITQLNSDLEIIIAGSKKNDGTIIPARINAENFSFYSKYITRR